MGKLQTLDHGARWLRDGLLESVRAGACESLDVDVSEAKRTLQRLKSEGRSVTWTHLFVRAVAITLARHPELHQLVAGNQKLYPSSVDICLSVAGDSSVTPVVIIEDAAAKDVFAIGAEVIRRTPAAARESEQLLRMLNRWGWILPFSMLRRSLLRLLLQKVWYRRKVSGTFQISCIPHVDFFAPMLFNTTAALGIGRVREAVIAVNGVPTVRPVVTLTCCLDHAVWNGMEAARFLMGLREVLQSGEFAPRTETVPTRSELVGVAS
jgi:pyruvate/2-oxoglutarate dehydrogenase complex dihydrolipoamide acyltransferase (E2) component